MTEASPKTQTPEEFLVEKATNFFGFLQAKTAEGSRSQRAATMVLQLLHTKMVPTDDKFQVIRLWAEHGLKQFWNREKQEPIQDEATWIKAMKSTDEETESKTWTQEDKDKFFRYVNLFGKYLLPPFKAAETMTE